MTKLGHVVRNETGGFLGLRIFSEGPNDFDLAILDINMADLTGFELAQRLRRIQPGFPVILYGGNIDSSMTKDAKKVGIFCLEKPATKSKFQTTINRVFGK